MMGTPKGKLFVWKSLVTATLAIATVASATSAWALVIRDGFGDADSLIVNENGDTLFDLLGFIAGDKSRFGFAIHVNYNALGQITEFNSIDFEDLITEVANNPLFTSTTQLTTERINKTIKISFPKKSEEI